MSKLVVLGLMACKDQPSHPSNKIAFTLDGHLCGVTVPEVAHAIVKQAVDLAAMTYFVDGRPASWGDLMQETKFNLVGRILANRKDLDQVAKRV